MIKKVIAVCCAVGVLGAACVVLWDYFPPSRQRVYSIGAYAGPSLPALESVGRRPAFSANQIHDVPARFVADPFLFPQKDRLLMFFEVIDERSKQGDIGLATSEDGVKWTYAQVVLDETFHLSFPHVFEWKGAYYMIPEASQSQTIRLYKARSFPEKWEFIKTLLPAGLVDPVLLNSDGIWWLFCSATDSELRLYYSADLLGDWQEHPKSPIIVNDPGRARMGGKILEYNGHLYRIAQNSTPVYGSSLRAFEILSLTTNDYLEREAANLLSIKPGTSSWNKRGMHHFDAVHFKGHWIAVADGWTKKVLFGRF